jgi:hypothetical protein
MQLSNNYPEVVAPLLLNLYINIASEWLLP